MLYRSTGWLASAAFMLLASATPAVAQACNVMLLSTVQPIFNTNCVACHQNAAPGAELSLQRGAAVANTVNVPSTEAPQLMRIVPGDAEASYLFRKISGTHVEAGGSGEQMPPTGVPLSEKNIAAIRAWIEDCQAAG